MVRLEDMKDDSLELLDDELRELGAYIADELKRREKEREDQARKKVIEAIQNFLSQDILFGLMAKLNANVTIGQIIVPFSAKSEA